MRFPPTDQHDGNDKCADPPPIPHDPGHEALKGAVRLALVTTSLFAFGDAIGNGQIALYGAFGSIPSLDFAPFGGPPASRLRAYLVLAVTGLVMVTLGTLASHDAWIAGLSMTVIAFVILMAGILNGYVAAGANAALLAFVISVMIPVPASQIPDRLAGWALAALAAISAAMLVWPSRGRDQVRADIATALRALAYSVAELVKGDPDRVAAADDAARGAIDKLRRTFTSVPYRPTGATGPTAALSRLVGDLSWLRPLVHTLPGTLETRQDFGPEAERLETAAIDALRASASTLRARTRAPRRRGTRPRPRGDRRGVLEDRDRGDREGRRRGARRAARGGVPSRATLPTAPGRSGSTRCSRPVPAAAP